MSDALIDCKNFVKKGSSSVREQEQLHMTIITATFEEPVPPAISTHLDIINRNLLPRPNSHISPLSDGSNKRKRGSQNAIPVSSPVAPSAPNPNPDQQTAAGEALQNSSDVLALDVNKHADKRRRESATGSKKPE
jgi:hypothetical protein